MDTSSTEGLVAASFVRMPAGSVAVVTGAATGIGLSTALRLARDGVQTYGLVRALEDVPVSEQARIRWIAADVSERAEIDRAMAVIEDECRCIDLLVSNAAVARHCEIGSVDLAELQLMINTNIVGFFNVVAASLPLLKQSERASIVAIASVHSMATAPLVSGYAATKGALVAAARAAALDLGPLGIRVNVVLPGSVDTPMLRASAARRSPDDPELAIREWGARHPLGRILDPHEIADAVIFLGGPAASGITGSALVVDGGLTARLAL